MDDQRKDNPDPKRAPKMNHIHQLYRPITCLLMMWEILTAQIKEEIYYSLISHRLFIEEQRVIKKNRRSTIHWSTHPQGEQNETKKCSYGVDWQQKGIWCGLAMYKITDEVIKFIEETMKNWRVELIEGETSLTGENSQRYIPRRCTITIIICNSDDTTHSHRKRTGGYKLTK